MRELTTAEIITDQRLRAFVGDYAFLEPTQTGLDKSIIDATLPLRSYLAATGAHDYSVQGKGPSQKRMMDGRILTSAAIIDAKVSLYRPETKDGDPRIWVSGLRDRVNPNDVLAVFYHENIIHIVNITRSDLAHLHDEELEGAERPDLSLLRSIKDSRCSVAEELVRRLTRLAGGWLRSVGHGDTAVGRTLEYALSIQMNSSKQPDFKGIEIKSKRYVAGGAKTRTSIFAQVPHWSESPCAGSEELLQRYGYTRNGVERLYCQINHGRYNSQGLRLVLDEDTDMLMVVAHQSGDRQSATRLSGSVDAIRQPHIYGLGSGREVACIWHMERLRERLREKHAETFWVDVESRSDGAGHEEFRVRSAIHTRGPFAMRLGELITRDIVSVDFLIKRLDTGGAKDKGYLFKLKPGSLDELFPPAQRYSFVRI